MAFLLSHRSPVAVVSASPPKNPQCHASPRDIAGIKVLKTAKVGGPDFNGSATAFSSGVLRAVAAGVDSVVLTTPAALF
jgi:hypothetical protein